MNVYNNVHLPLNAIALEVEIVERIMARLLDRLADPTSI